MPKDTLSTLQEIRYMLQNAGFLVQNYDSCISIFKECRTVSSKELKYIIPLRLKRLVTFTELQSRYGYIRICTKENGNG
jgi:hypothetical protein